MRFLFINQFYPPDVAPTGHFLRDVARVLSSRAHSVKVLASRTPYAPAASAVEAHSTTERADAAIEVQRLGPHAPGRRSLPTRAWRASTFAARVRRALTRLQPRPDLVIALTSPPFLGAALGCQDVPVAHWVMDLYPDALAAHGLLRADRLPFRALAAFQRRAWRRSALVLTLGPYMEGRLRAACGAAHVTSVPLWGQAGGLLVEDRGAARTALGWAADDLVLLYSGNLGAAHRCGEFLEAARQLGPKGPLWGFSGGGARRADVARFQAQHPAARVALWPYAAAPEHARRLIAADVHLASLSPTWQGVVVPSKVPAAFAQGRPVLFVGPPDNEVADWISTSGGGWVVPPDDVPALLRALAEAGRPGQRELRGAAAHAFAVKHFDATTNTLRIADLLERAARGERPRA